MSEWQLSFRRSPSPRYRTAVRLAAAIPGYRLDDEDEQPLHVVPIDHATLPSIEELLRLVSGWQSTRIEADGIILYAHELWPLVEMLQCYRHRERSTLGDLHCQGFPEGPAGVSCRLIDRAVSYQPLPPGDEVLWTRLLHAHAVETTAYLCPAFNEQRLLQTLVGRLSVERLLADIEVDLEAEW